MTVTSVPSPTFLSAGLLHLLFNANFESFSTFSSPSQATSASGIQCKCGHPSLRFASIAPQAMALVRYRYHYCVITVPNACLFTFFEGLLLTNNAFRPPNLRNTV